MYVLEIADRERVARVLRERCAEGRLDIAEFDARVGALYGREDAADLDLDLVTLAAAGALAPRVTVSRCAPVSRWIARFERFSTKQPPDLRPCSTPINSPPARRSQEGPARVRDQPDSPAQRQEQHAGSQGPRACISWAV
jgi:hypothetical protein